MKHKKIYGFYNRGEAGGFRRTTGRTGFVAREPMSEGVSPGDLRSQELPARHVRRIPKGLRLGCELRLFVEKPLLMADMSISGAVSAGNWMRLYRGLRQARQVFFSD